MKKVLSFVLVLSMILGSFGMAFAAAPSDVAGKEYEDAVNVLIELGVVEGYKDGSYRPENVVTRAEMATLIIKALGLNDYAVGKSSFTDMNGHWASPYVAYATSLGFVSGFGDNTFRPDQTVTYDQAITMLVQALGYKGEFMVGGYPGAFVAQAKTLGMLEGIKSGAAGANRGDVATLLYNTLPASFVRYDRDGFLQEITLDKKETKDTMLRRLGAKDYNGGYAFIVDGEEEAVINMKPYVGAYVTAYMNDDDEIIAIDEVKSVFLTGKVDDDKFKADGVKYTYKTLKYTDDKNASQAAIMFENGVAINTSAALGEDTVTIAANVSGKTLKDIYSISTWNVTVAEKVEAADLEDVADDCKLLGKDFATNDDNEIDEDSFELIGVSKLSDIKEDNVVYVYVGDDEITRVAVGTEVVTGKVAKKNAKDEEITVDGKVYGFAEDSESVVGDVNVGDSYDLYLDYNGDIFLVDAVEESADDYAIVLDRADGEEGLNGSDPKIQLLLADATKKTFVIDDDAIDEDAAKTDIEGVTAVDQIEANYTVGSVVKYAVKDGLVTKLEKVTMTATAKADISKKGSFDGHMLASNVVILTQEDLTVDAAAFSEDADDYGTTKRADVLDQEDVVASYLLDDGEIVFMVMDGQGTSGDIVYGFVTKIDELADDEFELTVMVEGKEVSYTTESKDFKIGTTLYAFDFDSKGYAKDAKDDSKAQELTSEVSGEITRVTDKVFVGDDKDYALTLDADVVIYEVNKDKQVEVASKSDLRGNQTADVTFYDVDEDGVADIAVF